MVRVAACQIAADVDGSRDEASLVAAVTAAARAGAQLVVLPELALTGSCFASRQESRSRAETVDGPTVRLLRRLSADLDIVVVAGFPLREDDVHNAAAVTGGGELLGIYRKVHLWDGEHRGFTPGAGRPLVLDTAVGRLGVMICYDLEFPEWARLAVEAGAQVLTVPANWPLLPRPSGVAAIEVAKAQAIAAAYGVYVVVADRCGVERGVDWVGGSLIVDRSGYLLAGPATSPGQQATPTTLIADIEPMAADDKRVSEHNHLLGDRRPDLYAH